MKTTYQYTVVELAGYIGENDRRSFDSAQLAWDWIQKTYSKDEEERLHVDVRKDGSDGSKTYEC